jgi:hypothetical protein
LNANANLDNPKTVQMGQCIDMDGQETIHGASTDSTGRSRNDPGPPQGFPRHSKNKHISIKEISQKESPTAGIKPRTSWCGFDTEGSQNTTIRPFCLAHIELQRIKNSPIYPHNSVNT